MLQETKLSIILATIVKRESNALVVANQCCTDLSPLRLWLPFKQDHLTAETSRRTRVIASRTGFLPLWLNAKCCSSAPWVLFWVTASILHIHRWAALYEPFQNGVLYNRVMINGRKRSIFCFNNSAQTKKYFNSTKSHCLNQTFNSFEICLFTKYSSSLPEYKLNLYGCIISRGLAQPESVMEALWLLVLNGSQQIFKPAKPTALIHYTWSAVE